MSYKVYITKNSKPVIHQVDAKSFLANRTGGKLLVLILSISTVLFLGMRAPGYRSGHTPPQVQQSQSAPTPAPLTSPPAAMTPDHAAVEEISPETVSRPDPMVNEPEQNDWLTLAIASGDNLSVIFDREKISRQDLDTIISLGQDTKALKRLMPGHPLRVRHTDGRLEELEYEISHTETLHVYRRHGSFAADTVTVALETNINHATGIISDSLFLSAQRAGVSDNLIMQLIDIYAWDIDFALDIREGDRFSILYEEQFKDGVKVKDGPILAAEFVNQERVFYAVRYTDAQGYSNYYNQDGYSMRKSFLRTPVNFTRISSRFSLARKHPVLNRIRAHKGVDYAAPTGTPVKATGDGTVAFAGFNGGYGRMVTLRHGEKYSTVYGHLQRFAKNISAGRRVTQGQTIGYVGMTGLATGPHLHYEFRIFGVHHNPLTVKLPAAPGIPKDELGVFRAQTQPLLAQLETRVASAGESQTAVALLKESAENTSLE